MSAERKQNRLKKPVFSLSGICLRKDSFFRHVPWPSGEWDFFEASLVLLSWVLSPCPWGQLFPGAEKAAESGTFRWLSKTEPSKIGKSRRRRPPLPARKGFCAEFFMKVIIMCGGKGTRLREETAVKPKPMVEIGGRPILWHIMHIYSRFGYNDFVLPLGYKGEVIKQYFADYHRRNTNFTVSLKTGDITTDTGEIEDWRVTLCDTGCPLHRHGSLHGHLRRRCGGYRH